MKDPAIEMVIDPIAEARRYVENTQTILKEHGNLDYETQLYQDRKYVRMAGNTLWNGVLLIIDAVFHVKRIGRMHPDVIDYRDEVAKRDKNYSPCSIRPTRPSMFTWAMMETKAKPLAWKVSDSPTTSSTGAQEC